MGFNGYSGMLIGMDNGMGMGITVNGRDSCIGKKDAERTV